MPDPIPSVGEAPSDLAYSTLAALEPTTLTSSELTLLSSLAMGVAINGALHGDEEATASAIVNHANAVTELQRRARDLDALVPRREQ